VASSASRAGAALFVAGFGVRARPLRWLGGRGVVALQVPVRAGGVRLVGEQVVGAAHAQGLQVHVWTVDAPAQMHALLDVGVDGIITDRADVLRDVLRARGQWSA
ncbi:glycerophosphodiester phosphodiesterase family protein, partial [Kineococcus glutinatus]|uniref:glycerophosphodiester phosphodiesterase family protein n=1 Tax=Kineococcus glutinatus TaxID=1070872 RepID=UPI0031E6E54B